MLIGLLILLTMETAVSEEKKDVAFPTLPKGAGQIAADAPKTFSQTPSGLQYRVLRAAAKPTAA